MVTLSSCSTPSRAVSALADVATAELGPRSVHHIKDGMGCAVKWAVHRKCAKSEHVISRPVYSVQVQPRTQQ